MSAVEFLSDLRDLGVKLWADGDILHCDAPRNVLTAELEAEIRKRKPEILVLLRQNQHQGFERVSAIGPVSREGSLPLSFAQSRLWFLAQLDPESAVYNESAAFQVDGALNIDALREALNQILCRHEALRTNFSALDGIPVQVIHGERNIDLKIVDVSTVDARRRDVEARRLVTEEACHPFNLARDLLLRCSLIRLDPEQHILVLVMHHIVSDGWSFGVLFEELSAVYQSLCEGRAPVKLPELSVQYADYAVWQHEYLKGAILEERFDYWKDKLKGADFSLDFAWDRPRPPTQSFKGGRYPFQISKHRTQALKQLGRSAGSTLFMVLFAAFNVLLHRYTGQRDLVVGSPVSGRSHVEIEGLIGFFVNSLVLRTKFRDNSTFLELLIQVRKVVVEAFEHQDLPFEKLVEKIQPERDRSRNPLFQAMFVLQDEHKEKMRLSDLTVHPMDLNDHTAKVDLTLSLFEVNDQLSGFLEYSTDLFEVRTIKRMVGHFETLIEGIVSDPGLRISDLPLLTDAERRELLTEFNRTERDYPRHRLTQELFEQQAARTPERTALVFGETSLCYAELDARATRMARALRARGVSRGQRVGLCVERGFDMLAAVLGILKAGAAYVPLDPYFPPERLRFMVDDAQLTLLVSTSALSDRFSLPRDRQLLLDSDAVDIASHSGQPLGRDELLDARAEDPAYVIYTSGSTGKPKGVVVPHRAVVNLLVSMAREPGLNADDVLLAVTTLSFDIAVLELQLPLTVGASVVIASRQESVDGHALNTLLGRHRASVMQATPVTWRMLLDSGWKGYKGFKALVGGETLPEDLAGQLLACDAEVWNMYGPTETTVWSTCGRITDSAARITIGKPIANTQVYILDPYRNLCPVGVPGELCIGGDGVTLGYWNRPELTAERFIPDPFSATPGAKLYRTGDLVRICNDGTLEHRGRLDFQVKIRGYRIELGEIEATIVQHRAIRETVVVVREDDSGDPRLVAYLIAEDPPEDLVDELRVKLRAVLPDYMVPSSFVFLDAMPLTPNAKVDRKALPAPDRVRPQADYVPPQSETEETLCRIWADALKFERIGRHDNFFELGGHSLLATQVIFQSSAAFGIEISLSNLFDAPTVAAMSDIIQRLRLEIDHPEHADENVSLMNKSSRPADALPTVIPKLDERHLPFPLTDIQQAYWLGRIGSFSLGNVGCHFYQELDCPGLDVARLNQAWCRLIDRHDMLRAVVLPDGNQQILAQVPAYHIEMLDLRGQDAGNTNDQLSAVREKMSHQVMEPDKWPLFEIRASLLDDAIVRLHISTDALTLDAWSGAIIARELVKLYQTPDTILKPLDITFRDYVLADLALRESELYLRAKDYWWNRLPSFPAAPEMPLANTPESIVTPRFVRKSSRLEPDVWSRLKARANRKGGLTGSGLLLAAFSEVLRVWSKGPRFTVNLTLFNRLPLHTQVNDVVGDFTSLILLAAEQSINDTFEVRARDLQKQLWSDLDHRFVGGVEIMRELAKREGRLDGGLMPVVFTSALGQETSGEIYEPLGPVVYSISQTPQVWLDHIVFETKGALNFNWDVVEGLFPEGMLDDMFDSYCGFLRRLATDESTWLESGAQTARSLIPSRQLEQRASINNTVEEIPEDLLHGLFAKQLPERSQHAAVISAHRTLSYDELSRYANRIGHWLRGQGVERNTLVAVVMEKGWEQIAGVLGTLASGAAYLPVDASLPDDRLRYILQHAEVECVLTQPRFAESIQWPESVQRLTIDDESLSGFDDRPLKPIQRQDDLAYVIYTSGSTGLPKGVMINHRGAVNTILDLNKRFSVQQEDRVLALSSLSFDLSVYDVFGILAAGGTIVIPEPDDVRDPAHWAELVSRHSVTLWNSVPALMQMLVEYFEGRGELLPKDLRLVFMSGDWIPVALPEQIRRLSDGIDVISMGGATEASIWSIIFPVEQVDPTWKSIPYGRPMVNQTFHVLNEALEPCPVWVPGQLYIGGLGLAMGYWRDEGKTAASFIEHPRTGERLYLTGDQGRYLPDGNIEFLGRDDFQVKIQGYRVELEEIETVLGQHPEVRNSVVVAQGETFGNKRLIAFIVPKRASIPATDEVMEFLRSRLPDYMVPSVYVMLDQLPLSANGKVDRGALPELEVPEVDFSPQDREDTSEEIAQISTLVAAVLKVPHVNANDNFFDHGATSIEMIRIVNALERELDFRPKVQDVYRSPMVAALADSYQKHQARTSRSRDSTGGPDLQDYEEGQL